MLKYFFYLQRISSRPQRRKKDLRINRTDLLQGGCDHRVDLYQLTLTRLITHQILLYPMPVRIAQDTEIWGYGTLAAQRHQWSLYLAQGTWPRTPTLGVITIGVPRGLAHSHLEDITIGLYQLTVIRLITHQTLLHLMGRHAGPRRHRWTPMSSNGCKYNSTQLTYTTLAQYLGNTYDTGLTFRLCCTVVPFQKCC